MARASLSLYAITGRSGRDRSLKIYGVDGENNMYAFGRPMSASHRLSISFLTDDGQTDWKFLLS